MAVGTVHPATAAAWGVTIALDTADRPAELPFDELVDSRFQLSLGATAWSFFFCHHGRASELVVTDVVRAQRDDFGLLGVAPPRMIEQFVRSLETTYEIRFRRDHVSVTTDLGNTALVVVCGWVAAL